MNRFYADKFVRLMRFVAEAKAVAEHFPEQTFIPEEDDIIITLFTNLRTVCEEIGLKFSTNKLDKIIKRLSQEETPSPQVKVLLDDFVERIEEELSDTFIMTIPQRKAEEYYENPSLFGENVFNCFSSANFDIEEAGKCFAAARYTASVMHLQRVLEVGLKSYGTFLGIASLAKAAQPSWNRVLDETRKEIKERNDNNIPAKVWASDEEKDFCQAVQPFLEAVQTAWRNPSMHADAKYTEDEAKEIFDAVKGFMRRLAGHLNEKGKFQKKRRK